MVSGFLKRNAGKVSDASGFWGSPGMTDLPCDRSSVFGINEDTFAKMACLLRGHGY